eukprot:TRINITY_DN32405_c0_g1_i1.p1 TRINITY_DN32405_c0_g1~~TRINITY_DN32405_c0_g1_i1.p1  ORF type:complete len:205 (+),score=37.97 TRINITY_DN32405_c0_g1_i1:39-617(+)
MPVTGHRIWRCTESGEVVVRPERHGAGEYRCVACGALWERDGFHLCPGRAPPGHGGIVPVHYEALPPGDLRMKVAELFCEEDLSVLQGSWYTGSNVEVNVRGSVVLAVHAGERQQLQVTPAGVSLLGVRLLGTPVGRPVRLVWADGDVWARKGAAIPTLWPVARRDDGGDSEADATQPLGSLPAGSIGAHSL